MRVPRVKGSVLLEIKHTVLRDHGREGLERVLAGCSAATQELLRGAVVGSKFYPETAVAEVLTGATQLIGPERWARYARELAKSQVNGVLRFLLRFVATPRMLSQNNDKLWKALHDTGSLTVTHGADDLSHTLLIDDFVFPSVEYEKAFVEFHCGVLELAGVRNVTGVSRRASRDSYVQEYTWER